MCSGKTPCRVCDFSVSVEALEVDHEFRHQFLGVCAESDEPIDKLVLIVMADGTPPDGLWNGSIEKLALICCMTEEAVQQSLRRLVAAQILGKTKAGYHMD
ncbi:hypothetical protein CSW58_10775 [Caulobacter sp. B11]|nr:hypothetical protein CSW58_10775 [Caulobacter sp. B11]